METSSEDQPKPEPILLPEGYHAHDSTIQKALDNLEAAPNEISESQTRRARRNNSITTTQINPLAVEAARILANNEMGRVVYDPETDTATVHNSVELARAARAAQAKKRR